eukprot:TRINITY_DN3774_c0_g2_i1.p1 TRINITY_DN3774_c0_g2~~TRINITY_DN3774_c0_g2_i1.p1  ORF type:complete len:995 (-),score=322.61 TRINITY_DN3774_c0_g2_i1:6-2990(-)
MSGDKRVIKVHDKDGVYRTMVALSSTTATEIVATWVKKLHLKDGESAPTDLVLFIVADSGAPKKIPPAESILPYIIEHEDGCKAKGINPQDRPVKFLLQPPPRNDESSRVKSVRVEKPVAAPPPPQPVEEEVAGYLRKKRKGVAKTMFETFWVIYRTSPVRTLSLLESETSSDAITTYSLDNASVEIAMSEGQEYLIIVLSNAEKLTFHSEEESVIQQWAEVLQATPNNSRLSVSGSKFIKPFAVSAGELRALKKTPVGQDNLVMQQKVLVTWVNYLIAGSGITISNLDKDLRDGVALSLILEVLFVGSIKAKIPKSVFENNENVGAFLQALAAIGINTPFKSPQDISEASSPKQNIILLWSIVYKFLESDKDNLLEWCKNYAATRRTTVSAFGGLMDGTALAAIIHEFKPEAIDFKNIGLREPMDRIALVIESAAKLGIPKLFAPAEAPVIDDKCWSLYASFFYLSLDTSNIDKWTALLDGKSKIQKLEKPASRPPLKPAATSSKASPSAAAASSKPAAPATGPATASTTTTATTPTPTPTPASTPGPAEVVTEKPVLKPVAPSGAGERKSAQFVAKAPPSVKPAAPSDDSAAKPAAKPAAPSAAVEGGDAKAAAKPAAPSKPGAKKAKPDAKPQAKPAEGGAKTPAKPAAKPAAGEPTTEEKSAVVPSGEGSAGVVVPEEEKPTTAPASTPAPAPTPVEPEKKPAPVPVVEEKKPEPAPVVTPAPTPAPAPVVEEKKPEPSTPAVVVQQSATAEVTPVAVAESAVITYKRPIDETAEIFMDEKFKDSEIDERLAWYNPPANWGLADTGLVIYPDDETDFWRKTHYGFEKDNGHYLYLSLPGNFTITTRVQWVSEHQYDQGGLMIRLNESCWLKTSVEYESEHEPSRLGVVVTNYGYSDWSTMDWPVNSTDLTLRIRRQGSDYFVEYYNLKADKWVQIRMAHLFNDDGVSDVLGGIYACSPKMGGCEMNFEYLTVTKEKKASMAELIDMFRAP